MSSAAQLQQVQGKLLLVGELNRQTAVPLLQQGQQAIVQAASPVSMDLAQVTQVSSAGIALLIEWIKFSQQQQKELLIENLPKAAEAIIAMSNLQPLFAPQLRPAA